MTSVSPLTLFSEEAQDVFEAVATNHGASPETGRVPGSDCPDCLRPLAGHTFTVVVGGETFHARCVWPRPAVEAKRGKR